jgi:hypothetical protein
MGPVVFAFARMPIAEHLRAKLYQQALPTFLFQLPYI